MSTRQMLHIGMIGTGSISDLHMRCYAKNEDAVIYAICDLNEERAKAAAQNMRLSPCIRTIARCWKTRMSMR